MNATLAAGGRWLGLILLVALPLLVAGCATNKVDWAGRIGVYTYDQAVLELGPPDKQAKLGSGTVVAEWLTWRGSTRVYPAFMWSGYSCWYGGPIYSSYYVAYPDYFLRLTFGADGKLEAWKTFAR